MAPSFSQRAHDGTRGENWRSGTALVIDTRVFLLKSPAVRNFWTEIFLEGLAMAGFVMIGFVAAIWAVIFYLGRDAGLSSDERHLRQQVRELRRKQRWSF